MRPLGPLPLTRPRSTPSSRASLRTPGPACAFWNASSSITAGASGGSSHGGGIVAVGPPYSFRGVGCSTEDFCGSARSTEGACRPSAFAGASRKGFSGSTCSPGGVPARDAATGCSGVAGSCGLAPERDSLSFASRRAISEPSDTLSPTFTATSRTVPAAGEGTSMVALSDSSVTSGASAAIWSPGFTNTSITGTSLKSPMSGTLTSMATPSPDSVSRDRDRNSSAPPPRAQPERLRPRDHFPEDGPRTEQLHLRLRPLAEPVHPLQDPCLRSLRHVRVCVVLVHHRQVVVDVLLLLDHPAQTVLHDDRELVLERGIVSDAVRDGARHDVAVTVLVLQPFAVQRRAAGSGRDEEPARAHVPRSPGQVADALEPEHRIKEVDGNHLHAVGAVRRSRRNPGGDGPGLVDSLLEDLPVLRFLVEHQLIGILRPVELADVRVDAVLPEHAFHAERARLVGDDGDHPGPDVLVAQ